MVRRMLGPEGISATALSKEVGIAQPTLSRWVRDARSLGSLTPMNNQPRDPRSAKKSNERPAQEKLRVVLDAAKLSGEELGAFLRREGVHTAQLGEWTRTAMAAAEQALSATRKAGSPAASAATSKRVRELEKELRRKEKALAELAALLALKKKLETLWADEDGSTPTRSET